MRYAMLAALLIALPAVAAPLTPLDRVPADAALFAHLDAGNLWEHPAIQAVRKTYAKQIDEALKEIEKNTGMKPEMVQSATFHFPRFPQGPGDEKLFVLQIVTKKPYDRDTLLAGLRPKGEMAKGEMVRLEEGFMLHFTGETHFTITHNSLVDEAIKGIPAKEGVQKSAIADARAGKHALTVGLDPSMLPAEIFSSAPPELQPFLPLLKSKSIQLNVHLDKQLTARVKFVGENEDKAVESEQAFNLLMKLADDGITTLTKREDAPEELKAMIPSFLDLQKVVQGIKAVRKGNDVVAEASVKPEPAYAQAVGGLFLQPAMASGRGRSANNLKQIGLALHNYESAMGTLPAGAIVDKKGKPLLSWRVAILPYIEQNNLYQKFKLDEPWDSPNNLPLSKLIVPTYRLPYGESKEGITHYRAFFGNGAAFDPIQPFKLQQFTDGVSNTIFAFEAAEGTPWSKPDEIEFDPKKEVKKHFRFENKLCQLLFADGSVRAFSETVKEDVLKLIIQKDDGMPVSLNDK